MVNLHICLGLGAKVLVSKEIKRYFMSRLLLTQNERFNRRGIITLVPTLCMTVCGIELPTHNHVISPCRSESRCNTHVEVEVALEFCQLALCIASFHAWKDRMHWLLPERPPSWQPTH